MKCGYIIENIPLMDSDSSHELQIKLIARVLSEVIETRKLISLNDLVILSISNNSYDVLGALFAELTIRRMRSLRDEQTQRLQITTSHKDNCITFNSCCGEIL